MTISTTTIKNSYSGDGSQTVFAYSFKILDQADIQVIIRAANGTETIKTITTHYTVSGVGAASGGNVTFTTGNVPTNTETVVIRRTTTKTQTVDLVENDPFTAETVEGAFDRSVMIGQEIDEEVGRSIKLSRTNTMTSTEFTVDATTRANKILAFDSSGEIAVTQELGTYKGNWGGTTSYAARDLVKDTSTNNIFLANTAHTSSGSQPLTTNTDSAKWDLIVDAASAATSATAAASSATAAATSATASASSATAASSSKTAAASSQTAAASSQTAAASSQTAAASSATAAAGSASAAAATFDLFDDAYLGAKSSNPSVDNDGDALADGALYFDTTNDVMKVYNLASTTWLQLTPTVTNQSNINSAVANASNINAAVANASNINAAVSNATNINAAVSNASNINTVSGSITNVNQVGSNIGTVNEFGERYRVGSSDPTSSLDAGDLAFNTTAAALKYYNGSSWEAVVAGSLTDIVQDGSPQLGGNLDVVTHSLISTSNRDIAITPNGSGKVILDGLSFPTADGTDGQALTTDGSGNVAFETIQASEITTQGSIFSNYNTITSAVVSTTASTKNSFLFGPITISGSGSWTISGSGTLEIL